MDTDRVGGQRRGGVRAGWPVGVAGGGEPGGVRRDLHRLVRIRAVATDRLRPLIIVGVGSGEGVEDGGGDGGGVEAEPVGEAGHLRADVFGWEGGEKVGGVAGGADASFGPVEPAGPGGEPFVDDQLGERPRRPQ